MENLQPEVAGARTPPRGWPFFLVGFLLFLLGPALFAVQLRLKYLGMTWHVPILASLGILFMVASIWRRRGILRSAGLVLFVLVCGFEWWVVLVENRPPAYAGPAQPGRPVPAFATTLADGKAFTSTELKNGSAAVLLFFRGRW
jgi:hypothetical protein